MKIILFLVYCFISLIFTQNVFGSQVIQNITPILSILNPIPVVVDGEGLKIGLKLDTPLSSGFSFVLTPHHPESVSMKSKYCSKANGEEVLVITRRDSYYLLTAIQNTPSFECTFEIQTFYVINNPEYSLILTSPRSSPISIDWTKSMYQGQLHISMEKLNYQEEANTITSLLSLSIDSKTVQKKKMFIPITFSVEYDSYMQTTFKKNIITLNHYTTFFDDCFDSKGNLVAKFHVQSKNDFHDIISKNEIIDKVLVEVFEADTTETTLETKLTCGAVVHHYPTPKITVKLDLERYSTDSLDINSSLDPYDFLIVNTYSSSLARLHMNTSVNKMMDWNQNWFTTVKGNMIGMNLYFQFNVKLVSGKTECVVIKGLRSSRDEIDTMNSFNADSHIDYSYNTNTDRWTIQLKPNLKVTKYPIFYSTSIDHISQVTWATCLDASLEDNENKVFRPVFDENDQIDYSQLEKADIHIYSPLKMTENTPITIELESFEVYSQMTLNIEVPYTSRVIGKIYSNCKAYNSRNRDDILKGDELPVTTISSQASITSTTLSLVLSSVPYYKFIKCEVFGHFFSNRVNPNSLSGENAKIHINYFPIKLSPDNVAFKAIDEQNTQGLSAIVTSAHDSMSTLSSTDNTMSNSNSSQSSSTTSSKSTSTKSISTKSTSIKSISSTSLPSQRSQTFQTSAFSTQSTPSLRVHSLLPSGYHLEVTQLPVTLRKIEDEVIGSFILGLDHQALRPVFSVVMASIDTGYLTYEKEATTEPFNPIITIVNHPFAIEAYDFGLQVIKLDFTMFIMYPLSQFMISNMIPVYSMEKELLASTVLDIPIPSVTFTSDKGRGTYLTTHEQLMKSYLTNPETVDYVTIDMKVKTKFALIRINIINYSHRSKYQSLVDYIKDVKIKGNNDSKYSIQLSQGQISILFYNDVHLFQEEVETTITLSSLVNYPYMVLEYETTYTKGTSNFHEGVSGVASVIGLPDVISSGFVLDTSNHNFDYFKLNTPTTLELGLSDLWTTHYYRDNKVVCPVDDFNLFQWDTAEKNDQGDIVFSEVNTPITLTNIPTISSINLPITYTLDSTVKNSPRDTKTFTPLVYIPDFSHITNIVRVDDTGLPQLDTPITPDSDFIAFSITGYVFSPVSTLMINIYQLPIRPVKCKQYDTIVENTDKKTILYSVERDFSNSDPFDYQEFTVTCEFVYLPTTELRRGRYTGVMKATLESPTLGESSTTSLNEGFEVVVPAVNSTNPTDTDGKDTVTVNSQVIVRDTPATGLTPNQIDSLLDKYKEATNTVSGTDSSKVFIDDIKTYPVGESKYDTDVNIVIVPPTDTNSSLSLKDVQDINDKFVLDLGDSWEVSVAPPTYNVEVDECKGKCGVGCRLCGNGGVCTVNGDCLFKHCDSNTNKCTVALDTDTDTDNDSDNGSYSVSVRLFIVVLAMLSVMFI